MLSFKLFLITEEVSPNDKGVMHELLVGYHLRGGKHMERHKDANGLSPEDAHDKLKSSMTPEEYKTINDRAKAAAEDLRKKVGEHGDVHSVQWTSKEGDLHRATGIHATQKQDASDIVISTKNKDGEIKHHGVSLKVTDKKSGNVPVSNPGMESTYGGSAILERHRQELLDAHPALRSAKNKAERKEFVRANPKVAADIKSRNRQVMSAIVDHMHNKLSTMDHDELVHHIRNHILHAHQTPMQALGHNHIKHTTYGTSNFTHKHENPAHDFEHILREPQHISMKRQGTSVVFYHKGKAFAKHRIKFESQSDPLSSIKGSGEIM